MLQKRRIVSLSHSVRGLSHILQIYKVVRILVLVKLVIELFQNLHAAQLEQKRLPGRKSESLIERHWIVRQRITHRTAEHVGRLVLGHITTVFSRAVLNKMDI